jgi:hypothetical protein
VPCLPGPERELPDGSELFLRQAGCVSNHTANRQPAAARTYRAVVAPGLRPTLRFTLRDRPRFTIISDVDNRNDPVPTVHDDNLVADDKVHVPAPLGIDLDQGRRYRHHADARRYDRASAQGKVNVIDPGALRHDRLSYLCALLRRQVDVAALLRLALLGLTWLPALVLLRPLIPALTGLVLLSVALGRGLSSFASLRLRGLVPLGLALLRLALIPLGWARLVPLGLALLRLALIPLRWTRLVPLGLALLRLALIPLGWTRLGWTRLGWARLRWARLGWTRLACGTAALTATLLR